MAEDVTVVILREIRDEVRGTNSRLDDTNKRIDALREETNARFSEQNERFNARFEVIETALRDLAEQLVILGRGVKVAIDSRRDNDRRVDDLEARVDEIERRLDG